MPRLNRGNKTEEEAKKEDEEERGRSHERDEREPCRGAEGGGGTVSGPSCTGYAAFFGVAAPRPRASMANNNGNYYTHGVCEDPGAPCFLPTAVTRSRQ